MVGGSSDQSINSKSSGDCGGPLMTKLVVLLSVTSTSWPRIQWRRKLSAPNSSKGRRAAPPSSAHGRRASKVAGRKERYGMTIELLKRTARFCEVEREGRVARGA